MRTSAAIISVAALCSSACASGPYGRNATVDRTLIGVAAGAALGAAVGQGTGTGAFEGAVIGSALGGAAGAIIKPPKSDEQIYYRDTRGFCYYVDQAGQPHYVQDDLC